MYHDAPVAQIAIETATDPFAIRSALMDLRIAWDSFGADPETSEAAEQVLAEVLNNIVEHAHSERPDGEIRLHCSCLGDAIECDIRDNGAPMPNGDLPKGEMARIDGAVDDLPEGGFGWFMIREMTENLSYTRRAGWNHLRFRIPGQSG